MAKGLNFGQMDHDLKVNLRMVSKMVMENLYGKMALNTKASGQTIK